MRDTYLLMIFIFLMLSLFDSTAQTLLISDFEGGNTEKWQGNYSGQVSVNVVPNTLKTPINESDKVLKVDVLHGGMLIEAVEYPMSDITFEINNNGIYKYLHYLILNPTSEKNNGWKYVVADFSKFKNGSYNSLSLELNRTSGNCFAHPAYTIYLDQIALSSSSSPLALNNINSRPAPSVVRLSSSEAMVNCCEVIGQSVQITVFDMRGEVIRQLSEQYVSADNYQFTIHNLNRGAYLVRLSTPYHEFTYKLLI